MIMQNKQSIYQTDVFEKLFCYVKIMSNCGQYTDTYDRLNINFKKDSAYRIFADHMRTCIIAIFDGAEFDCNKRGFILRKIFRRLLMNYYLYLNNCNITPLTKHHIMNALITEILNFQLFKVHNADKIKEILYKEEMMYIGKIYKLKNKYNSLIKNKNGQDVINSFLNQIDNFKMTYGVDKEIIEHIGDIIFNDIA